MSRREFLQTEGNPRPRVGVKPPPVMPEACHLISAHLRCDGAVGGCPAMPGGMFEIVARRALPGFAGRDKANGITT